MTTYITILEIPHNIQFQRLREVYEILRGRAKAEPLLVDDYGLPQQIEVTIEAEDGWELRSVVGDMSDEIYTHLGYRISIPKPVPCYTRKP